MIAIKVDGRYMDLPRDARMRVKMPSQLFAQDFVSQGYSYPIALPCTTTNQLLMRFYDRIANTAEFEDIECTIELGGSHWRHALIKYRGFKDNAYDVDLQVPDDEAVIDMRGLRTTDLAVEYSWVIDYMTAVPDDVRDLFAAYNLLSAEDTDIIFPPFKNLDVFGGRTNGYYNSTDPIYNTQDGWVNILEYTLGSTPNRWQNEYVPLPYLCKVVEHMLEMVGLSLAGDVFRNEEVRSLVVMNNLLVNVGVGTDPSTAILFADIGPAVYPSAALKDMLPDISIIDLLLRVCRRFNAVPLFRKGRVLEIRSRVDVLNSSTYEDITRYAVPSRDMELEQGESLSLTSTPESSDTAPREENYDPTRIIGTVRTVADLATLSPTNGDLAVVEVTNVVYIYFNTVWEEHSEYQPELVSATGSNSVDVGVGFVRMVLEDGDLVPMVEQKLSDTGLNIHLLGPNPIEQLRLVFHRGNGVIVNDVYDAGGNVITGATMSETIYGSRGIYERWYEPWVRATQKARCRPMRVRLPLHMLRNFRWDRILMIDGNKYLCREIDVEFTTTGMGIPILDMLRLPTEITGRRLPISCAGRGHTTFIVRGGTFDLSWRTSTGYLSYRGEDGILTTIGDGSGSVQFATITTGDTADVPLCLFSSTVDHVSSGDILHLEASSNDWLIAISTNYLQDLDVLELTATAYTLETPLDLTTNTALNVLRIPQYQFETLDISTNLILAEVTANDSLITAFNNAPHLQLANINLNNCALGEVDSIFINAYNNSIAGVDINTAGGTSVAVTGASLTARNWLLANGGTLAYN